MLFVSPILLNYGPFLQDFS